MSVNYEKEPTHDEISKLFYGGLNLFLSPEATAQEIKNFLWNMHRAGRWKIAAIEGDQPDASGRIITEPQERKAA